MGNFFDLTESQFKLLKESKRFLEKLGCYIYISQDQLITSNRINDDFKTIKNGVIKLGADDLLDPYILFSSKIYFQPCTIKYGNIKFVVHSKDLKGYYPKYETLFIRLRWWDLGYSIRDIQRLVDEGDNLQWNGQLILKRYYNKLKCRK